MPVPEEDEMTRLGRIYDQVINISLMVRWAVYILPVASLLAIPIVLCDTVYYYANAAGIKLLGLFLWIEVVWMCLWMAKLCAILMPIIFQSTFGLVSSGMRKYSYLLRALEVPVSIFLWAILSFSTNRLIYVFNQHIPHLH
jgi:bacteriorhodopsin